MTTTQFLLAIWGLLLTPGPTNTLLALSGASVGLGRSLRLLPLELAAYLLVVLPLVLLGAELAAVPVANIVLKLAASAWVMLLAVRLWRVPSAGDAGGEIAPRRVFVTTLLNPKALVFGLVLLPHSASPDFLPRLGLFCVSILCIAGLWAAGGSMLNRKGAEQPSSRLYYRVAACWLAAVSIGLVGDVLAFRGE